MTAPLQTWLDLGPVLKRNDLVAVADFLCAGKHPRYQPSELVAAAERVPGRRGVRALREAASLARARVDSPKETETRLLILDAGLPEPVVGFEVLGVNLPFNPHVDLSWPAFKVCAEYEGEEHRTDRRRFRSDITRRERLEDVKWRVIRVTDDDLQNGGLELIQRIHNALVERGWDPTS
ncbi:hypothetical protein GCM10022381_33200 [Leifsonia kafniensis]|uniref:DUF559 domain-containing protein n=1 Tax=Leifsonia kafniensis TaxID=475957 RepID=A0ABP7KWG7_9MICO